ncbi:lanthionine synthetase LanC family protein [Nakamurella sp. GG22]
MTQPEAEAYLHSVAQILGATTIESATGYSWFGRPAPRLPKAVERVLSASTARNYLQFALQWQYYENWYCVGGARPAHLVPRAMLGRRSLVQSLREANSGSGYWSSAWSLDEVAEDKWFVSGGGIRLIVRPEDCDVEPVHPVTPGALVKLRFKKDLPSISPGYYMALGNNELSDGPTDLLVRLYWNLLPSGAATFVAEVTRALNDAQMPFRLKVLDDANQFGRADSGVIYIRKADYDQVSCVLGHIVPKLRNHLEPATPAMTKKLANGIALAEDPVGEMSFGQHRCSVMAGAVLRAQEQRSQPLGDQLEIAVDHFAENGVDLQSPYLNQGSTDVYGADWTRSRVHSVFLRDSLRLATSELNVAREIGMRLAQTAIWYDGRCNWMGYAEDSEPTTASPTMSYRALGPDLYSGTAGVALFLAELARVVDDSALRRTAVGAMRQSLSTLDTIEPEDRLGMYTGLPGIASAASRVGWALGSDEFIELSLRLASDLEIAPSEDRSWDLLSGSAGAIAVLVHLSEAHEQAELLQFAVQLGDQLVDGAKKSRWGLSWSSPELSRGRNLTGFSHGASGIAFALLELYRVSGVERFARAAELGFDYERYYFDADEMNWPDFREDTPQLARRKSKAPTASFWCHGAGGIALARLHAYRLLGHSSLRDEAAIAIDATARWIEGQSGNRRVNLSLCHGMAGNAEILSIGKRVLGQHSVMDGAAPTVGHLTAERLARNSTDPLTDLIGDSPGLMSGISGVGLFLVGTVDPSLQSALGPIFSP